MKQRKVYIFSRKNRASSYGVGTYIENLVEALQAANIQFATVYLRAESFETEVIEKGGYQQISIPFVVEVSKNSDERYERNVTFLLRDIIAEEPDTDLIFHFNFMENPTFVRQLKKMFHCKTVLTVHYTDWSLTLNGDFRRAKRLLNSKPTDPLEREVVKNLKNDLALLKAVDKTVFIAAHTRNTYNQLKPLNFGKTEIISNALKDAYLPVLKNDKHRLRQTYHITENEKVVLFAGRLDSVKGIGFLIKSFKKVLEKHPEAHLYIAGDGRFEEWITEAHGCWSKISFCGKLNRKTLFDLYRIADLGVACSLHEEFGLVALEMMMHALPMIATKTGGLDETVVDGVTGMKIPVRTRHGNREIDIRLLAEKICLMLDNPDFARQLGANARRRFLDNYEISTFAEKMLNIYQTV
jgi:glycosyltransferase